MVNKVYPLFFNVGEVVEIRALGLRGKSSAWEGFAGGKGGIVSGYFNDPVKFAAAAAALEKEKARGVYFTINPCKEPLLSRASNRLICPQEANTTPDIYMTCIRWLLIDLDAKLADGTRRPKGVSATDEELKLCLARAEEVAKFLEEGEGFSKGIRAFSGNGYHLVYRLPDLPNDEEHHALVVNATAALADKFGKEDIDVSVTNPGRIWKFYGTTGRKGDSTDDRPHRQSYIFKGQPETLADVPITSLDVLKKFAALGSGQATPAVPRSAAAQPPAASGPAAPSATNQSRPIKKGELGPIDMEKYLSHFGVAYDVKEITHKSKGPATAYRLERCIFNADHGTNEAAIIVPRAGAIYYQCFHTSCKGHTWKDARRSISGDKSLAEFCQGYDPNWQRPRDTGTGLVAGLSIPMTNALSLQNGIGSPQKVPAPADVPDREFFEVKGKRAVFVPWRLAIYLSHYLYPICHTSGKFYHYESGWWKEYPVSSIAQICVHAMRTDIQASWMSNVRDILAGLVNREFEEWPDNPHMINCKNGMLNVNTSEFLPHAPEYGSQQQLPVNYNPKADWSKRWMAFLDQIFFDDKDGSKRFLLQQYFGYCLLRDARYQKALFLYGTGSNGKSTVIDVLQAMVGKENTSSLSLNDMAQKFRASFLEHKLINLSSETSRSDPVESSFFKQVVDGSQIMSEQKYGKPYQFRSYAKWIVAMNDAPVIADKSYGFQRRMVSLYFNLRLEGKDIIPKYEDYLIEEIDGIFNWAVEGLELLLKNKGFKIGEGVAADTEALMDSINPFRIFITECCQVNDSPELDYYETTTQLWHAYSEWCKQGHNRPLGRNKFLEQIQQTFSRVRKSRKELPDGSQPTLFTGIKLTSEGENYAQRGQQRAEKPFTDRY